MDVSESERDRTVEALTRHCGEGRITLDELEERIELAYAAQTSAELLALVRDLPRNVPTVLGAPAPQPAPSVPRERRGRTPGETGLVIHLVIYVSVLALLCAIWLLTTPFGYFWPIWPAVGMGVPLAIHAGIVKAITGSHQR